MVERVTPDLVNVEAAIQVQWANARASMYDECFVKLCEDSRARATTTDGRKWNGPVIAPERCAKGPSDHSPPACGGSTARAPVVLGQVHF
jgi:hypothetical protein